jgi:hypothetical protein
VQGKGGKGHSKRKAPDELWTDGTIPERQNPLINFLADKLPKEFIQVLAASPSYDNAFYGKRGRGNRVTVSCLCTDFSILDPVSNKSKSISCVKTKNSLQFNLTNLIRRWSEMAFFYM